MKAIKRSLLLLLCVAMLIAGAIVMSACSKECTEHEWGNWTVTTAATCIAEGTETRTCNACGETETRKIEKTAHTFSEYVADGNATCIADGTKTATCTTSGCTAKDTVADAGSKKAHSFTSYTSNGDATCQADGTKTATCDTEGCTATETVIDTGSKRSHAFTTYHSDNNATCQADGTKTATCDWYGCTATDTVTDTGSKKAHSFTSYTSNGDATCVLDGTKTATCDFEGCSETSIIEDEGSKLGHLWDAELSCTTGHVCTRTGCDAEEAALGHSYIVIGGTELTCEQDSTTVYACQNGCGDEFTVTNHAATGHSVDEWTFDSEEFIGECTYRLTYVGTCQNPNCGEQVYKTENVERHTLKSTIHTNATCSVPGEKLITCSECNNYSVIENYTNPDAHVWGDPISVEGNVATYECSECGATKTAIIATDSTETTVNKEALESAGEVELKDANIKLDSDTLSGLEGDVAISAGTLEGEELDTVIGTLDQEKLDQIGDNPIYNFGLSDANGTVSSFNGYVTIRVPYELQAGDDVDSIAVWFINDNGEVESIQAVYDNGYAVFSTNHFSYYTVTRLTPAERCELYDHSFKITVVEATCVSDGYELKVCQRCGHSSKEITDKATGHNITTTTVGATCTESGTKTHSCENCDYKRTEKIAPTGHAWEATDTLGATCTSAGHVIYTCGTCSESYKTVIAQQPHSYVDTVTKATCTTDGYTTKVCEWCEYTVITNKISALGHDYKTTTVENSCTTDGYTLHDCSRCDASYKTDIVPPSHTWDIEAPTCGKGQTCIVCGKGGLSATGNHTMVNGVCSVCGTGCSHTYNSVVTAPTCTEVGFTTNTCTICGVVEKTDYKSATGHTGALSCTVCGAATVPADFYTNAFESLLNEKYTILINSMQMNEDMYIVDSEIYVSLKGGISGWGTVNIKAYGTVATFRAIIEDDVLYLCGENTTALTETKDMYAKIPFTKLISETEDAPAAVQMIATLVMNENVLNWASDSLLPFLTNLTKDGKDEANLIAETVVKLICDVEVVDGDIVITPNADKIKALNARLATETIGEFIDAEFGAGTYDDIVETIDGLFDLTVGDIIDGAKEDGADVIALVDSLDTLVATVIGQNITLSELMELETSIQDMLKDEELRAITIEQIVEMLAENMGGSNGGNEEAVKPNPDSGDGVIVTDKVVVEKTADAVVDGTVTDDTTDVETEEGPSIREQLAEMLAQLKGATLYQLAGNEMETDEAIKLVNDSIDTVFGDLTVSLKTDKNGTLLSLDVAYAEYFDVSVVADYTSTNDYSDVKDTAEANTELKANANSLTGTYEYYKDNGEYVFEIDDDGNIVGVWYCKTYKYANTIGSESDDSGNYVEVKVVQINMNEYTADLTDALIATHSDCKDWMGVTMMGAGTRSYTSKTVIERYVNGELAETIDDPTILEMLGYGSKSESYTQSEFVDVEFFIDIKTGEITNFDRVQSTLHDYEEDESKHKPATGCEGIGEYHLFCTECGETLVVPYTNGHDYEEVCELKDGATSCEDGVIVKRVCTVCGKIGNQYETDYHSSHSVDIDLSGYGACGHHYLYEYSCACGQESGFGYGGFEWVDSDTYACPTCGITIIDQSTYTPGESCTMNEVRVVLVTKNGATIYSKTMERTYESHNTATKVTLMEGSKTCEDGIWIEHYCKDCGKTYERYEEYYHREYEKIIADFSDYGSTCGGYIYSYGCACGYYGDKWVGTSSDCEFEYTDEYYRDWCDYRTKCTCAVTNPPCGFTYYRHAYYTETVCGRTCYEEYYVIDENGEKIVLYSYVTEDNVYHSYETLSEEKTAVDGHPCLYYVNKVEKCVNCEHEHNYVGYAFIHNESEHSDGYYCEDCGHGNRYVYDSEGNCIYETYVTWTVDGESRIRKCVNENGWIYYNNYSFNTLDSCSEEYYEIVDGKLNMYDSYRYRTAREYNFEGVCSVTVIYENSYGEGYTETRCACEHFNYNAGNASCTQHGNGTKTCVVCGDTSTYETYPLEHNWWWYDYEGCYVCVYCGLKNANGASGDIVLEDASDLDDDEDTYIVGYYNRYDGKFDIIYAITLIGPDGEELCLIDLEKYGITVAPWGEGRYVTFSKSAVINAAKEMGYTEDQFDIRISFVPAGWDSDLDYAITFEVMSATDECVNHFYYNGACVFCGYSEKTEDGGNVEDDNCEHYFDENGYCIYCKHFVGGDVEGGEVVGKAVAYSYNQSFDNIDENGNTVETEQINFTFYTDGTVSYSYKYANYSSAIYEDEFYEGEWKEIIVEDGGEMSLYAYFNVDDTQEEIIFTFDENGDPVPAM